MSTNRTASFGLGSNKIVSFFVFLLTVVIVALPISLLVLFEESSPEQVVLTSKAPIETGPFEFVNPLVNDVRFDQYNRCDVVGLDSMVNAKIQEFIEDKKAEVVSVYFRDLTNGMTWEINPEMKYSPASLLKVSVMLAVIKQSESMP